MNTLKHTLYKLLVPSLASAVLLAVFFLYLQPAFQQVLAHQLWGCL